MNEADNGSEIALFDLKLPADWDLIPVEPDEYSKWVTRYFDNAELSDPDRNALRALFRSLMIEARQASLVSMASFVDVIDDPDSGEEQILAAAMFASAAVKPDLDGLTTPYAWTLALQQADDDGDISLTRKPEIITVGDHELVKAVSLDQLSNDPKLRELRLFGVTYYMLLGGGSIPATVGFRTPCLWMTEEFEELFDTIIGLTEFAD